MAQYETPLAAAPEETPARSRKWPLAGVMVIDLVIMFAAVLVATTVIAVVFIGVRSAQQGAPLGGGGAEPGAAL